MTIMKIIDGLYFTIGMILFNPFTGESKTPDQLNEDDRTTYDACMGAIALLKAQENEIVELKQEIEGHKDNLRETLDEMMRYADELKAHEPRVMTYDELNKLHTDDVIWLEDIDKAEVIPAIVCGAPDYSSVLDAVELCAYYRNKYISAITKDYLKRWRCWTSRPDQATREATPWK